MTQNELQELVSELSTTVQLQQTIATKEQLLEQLREHIDHLISNDFNSLLTLLYRVDVDENQLRQLLAPSDMPASSIITSLIIERQLKKIETRKKLKTNADIPEDERW